MSNKILLIEDDPEIANILLTPIEQLGYGLESVLDGKQGLRLALSETYDLVIIDGNLPGADGFEICRQLRGKKAMQCILMLTSRVDEIDRILGLELGADDYVTKPFSTRELIARIKGLVRRSELLQSCNSIESCSVELPQLNPTQTKHIQYKELSMDWERRSVVRGQKIIPLTATEFAVLWCLAINPGKVFTRDELMERVWGFKGKNFAPTVTMTLSRLRTKLEPNPKSPIYVHNIRGMGYRFPEY